MTSVAQFQTPAAVPISSGSRNQAQQGVGGRQGQRSQFPGSIAQVLCRDFLRDACRYGDKCRYSHHQPGSEEGKEAPASERNRKGKGKQRQVLRTAEGATTANKGPERRGSKEQSTDSNDSVIQVNQLPDNVSHQTRASSSANGNVDGSQRKGACFAWKAGNCSRGDKCRFSHEQIAQPATANAEPTLTNQSPSGQGTSGRRLVRQKVYLAWQQTAREAKVAARIAQDNEDERLRVAESTRLAAEETTRRLQAQAREEAARIARAQAELLETERRARLAEQEAIRRRELQAQEEAARKILQAEQEALRHQKEAAVTTQHIVLGSTLITCGAGIEIRRVVSGFESCRLTIKNLPRSAKPHEIMELFTQQGMKPDDVHILHIKPVDEFHLEAQILTSAVEGGAIAVGLDGVEFGNDTLQFEISENTSVDAMGEASSRQTDILTVSWQAPSAAMIATYSNMDDARAKAQALNQRVIDGRRMKAEMNQPPTGPALRFYNPCSVKITGLSPVVSCDTVAQLAGTVSVRSIKSNNYDLQELFSSLRQHLDSLPDSGMKSFDIVSQNGLDGVVTVRAHFESWSHANRARESLAGRRLRLDYPTFRLSLPRPLQFISTIPSQQYKAQRRLWDSLAQMNDKKGSNIYINTNERAVVRVRVNGDNKKAVGALKVRVETLVAGEKLDANFWHRSFLSTKGRAFLDKVFDETGVYIRSDFKIYALKLYGDGDTKEDARRMITAEVERLAQLEWTVVLKRQTVGYFVRKGLAVLKEILGEDAVTLDLASTPCKLTIRGGEEARHALNTLMDQSLMDLDQRTGEGGDAICPICYDEVAHPITLGCKHVYCTACLRHYLTSAADTKMFPLACMGDEAKCKTPIPIPVIQRFLTRQQYEHLIKVAFSVYLGQHSQDFRYCTTPDCSQIYRCNAETMLKCPSCFAEVCSACHEEAHEGMTCGERQQRKSDEEEQLNGTWAANNGVKRCPSCQVWIEKTEGCNHMTCRCGAHICWKCMRVFPAGQIYEHLGEAHGGAFDGDDVRQNVDHEHAIALQRQFDEPQPFGRPAHEPAVIAPRVPVLHGPLPAVQPARRYGPQAADFAAARQQAEALQARRRLEAERARRLLEAERARVQADYQRQFDLRQARLLREAEERRKQEGRWCIVM
ncbi:ATP-dependent RNA helicase DEAH12, chloroplastic [Hypsizygus marmoreus]|uniref:RBR-type E3 ubiquitin transferase n=1 Tax=Hypsizygus marmoreus TaxID=39966 RepID=A0A369JH27_HYPMA|nr:ATP-dependent RNA helicase DEAH12, chloroplastic [Hypsizygus marmoreus]